VFSPITRLVIECDAVTAQPALGIIYEGRVKIT
jgi:hypothetical protein